ncbi:MAG: spiro-SPASM protein, partial [Termitinemataceae bacterium]
ASFPHVQEVVLLVCGQPENATVETLSGFCCLELPVPLRLVAKEDWTIELLLKTLVLESDGQDLLYYAWADCPFLDIELTKRLAERHIRYGAEYSFADGWPYGCAPELLAPTTAAVLEKIYTGKEKGSDDMPSRDALFQVLQRDINSFDIETEISPVDLRPYRLSLSTDSKRNFILVQRLMKAGLETEDQAPSIFEQHPDLLRTLPAFYQIQVARPCPQRCSLCPYPLFGNPDPGSASEADFMPVQVFTDLLDRIIDFSGDGVIDLSVWGEAALHPDIEALVRSVLDRPELSLIIETSGLGWKESTLIALSEAAAAATPRFNGMKPLTWILSLDAQDPGRYREVRGEGYERAQAYAHKLLALFPRSTYVQALRVKGAEDDIEQFYRIWKSRGAQVIIQKYDFFCGNLPALRIGDLSPLHRRPCWHLMRDMTILLDGSVPLCREDIHQTQFLGNVFQDSLETIWQASVPRYSEHIKGQYTGICKDCDEYYTYNF